MTKMNHRENCGIYHSLYCEHLYGQIPKPTIVWLNGCFDILHPGHLELIEYAQTLNSYIKLLIGIDSDEKVKRDKGENRPYFNQYERKYMLSNIKGIQKHNIFIFNTKEELENLIKQYRPDIMVVGSDWEGKEIVGAQYVKEIKYFPRNLKYSTTNILNGTKPNE